MLEKNKPLLKPSTPQKLTGAQIAHLLAKEMTSGKNVPGYKSPKKEA